MKSNLMIQTNFELVCTRVLFSWCFIFYFLLKIQSIWESRRDKYFHLFSIALYLKVGCCYCSVMKNLFSFFYVWFSVSILPRLTYLLNFFSCHERFSCFFSSSCLFSFSSCDSQETASVLHLRISLSFSLILYFYVCNFKTA